MSDAAFLLSVFCRRYDLDEPLIVRNAFSQAPVGIDYAGQDPFDGRVTRMRIKRYARFGNNLYQMMNAFMIARRLGVTELEIPLLDGGPENLPTEIDGIALLAEEPGGALRPVLVGSFYAPFGFEQCVGTVTVECVLDALRRFITPLYAPLLLRSGSLGNNVLAMHMRGGDIFFQGGSHRAYVQPPLAYYLRAVDFAVSRLGIDFVHLIFEDRTNPVVDAVEQALSARGIAYATQSASLIEDLASLISAHHIVAGHGTFCEAAALLSTRVESYFAFRSISSQSHIPAWSQAQFEATLQAMGVRTVRIDDPAGDFIAPGTWINSEEQRLQILNFPQSSLRLLIRTPPERARDRGVSLERKER
jgi:hypothetical protein